MQAATIGATSSSRSGEITTKGISTRQSVASVAWETRARPPKSTLSLRVMSASRRVTLPRSSTLAAKQLAKRSTATRAAASRRAAWRLSFKRASNWSSR